MPRDPLRRNQEATRVLHEALDLFGNAGFAPALRPVPPRRSVDLCDAAANAQRSTIPTLPGPPRAANSCSHRHRFAAPLDADRWRPICNPKAAPSLAFCDDHADQRR
jgi:hypothetical protein